MTMMIYNYDGDNDQNTFSNMEHGWAECSRLFFATANKHRKQCTRAHHDNGNDDNERYIDDDNTDDENGDIDYHDDDYGMTIMTTMKTMIMMIMLTMTTMIL